MALASARERRARALPRGLAYLIAGATGLGSDVRFGLASHLIDQTPAGAGAVPGAERFNPLAAALYRDLLHTNLTTLLRYGDRNSMAHAREVRLPFCDHRLAEFVLSLAPERLMGGAETKRLLRGALAGLIPEAIRTRWPKQGFLPPHADWLRGPLAPALRELVLSAAFADGGFWRARWWRRALERFERGDDALAMTLWRPFMAEAWQRHFVQRLSRMPRLPVFAEG
jgi:asparagine synthase (glutamine-hydrolysing)